MKTPMEVINSDNSSKINTMKEQVVEVCDIMFKNFECTINNINNKDSDKSFVSFVGDLPQDIEYDYEDSEFIQKSSEHFNSMIGDWCKYVEINFYSNEDSEYARNYWYCEIICRFDLGTNCYIEVERN